MPKFRYSLDTGTSWTVVDAALPFNIPSTPGQSVIVEPIGASVTDSAAPLDLIFGGQSNALFHRDRSSSPPTPNANTFMWNNSGGGWVAPTGNGLITLCDELQATTGRTVRVVVWGQAATPISLFRKGATLFTLYADLLARISASGINPAYSLWHQGENDAAVGTNSTTGHQDQLDGLHGELCADLGKTRAQMPWVVSSLGRATDDSGEFNIWWKRIQDALITVNSRYPNIHYSHSNVLAPLIDEVHWTAPGYAASGRAYARTVLNLMGLVPTRPAWFATNAARVSATETDVDVVHSMGTDFTPSTGITGFEVSNDNGNTWVAATGARVNATRIRLTHSSLGTVERLIRYQYGKMTNVTGAVVDNSSFANPLNLTATNVVAAGAVSLPVFTYADNASASGTGQTQTRTGIVVAGASESVLAVIAHQFATGGTPAYVSCSVTAQPSGTVIPATLIVKQDGAAGAPNGALYQAVLPAGTTSIDVTVQLNANPFAGGRFRVSTVPVARLNSTTPTGSAVVRGAGVSAVSANIPTSAGGIVFAASIINVTDTGTTGTFSGTETYTTRSNGVSSAATHAVGDASGTAANASSTVTTTFNATGQVGLLTASWR